MQIVTQNFFPLEDLPEKRFADCVNIYQVNWPADVSRQFGDQRHFLTGREAASCVDRQVQITFCMTRAGRQRTEQNGSRMSDCLLIAARMAGSRFGSWVGAFIR